MRALCHAHRVCLLIEVSPKRIKTETIFLQNDQWLSCNLLKQLCCSMIFKLLGTGFSTHQYRSQYFEYVAYRTYVLIKLIGKYHCCSNQLLQHEIQTDSAGYGNSYHVLYPLQVKITAICVKILTNLQHFEVAAATYDCSMNFELSMMIRSVHIMPHTRIFTKTCSSLRTKVSQLCLILQDFAAFCCILLLLQQLIIASCASNLGSLFSTFTYAPYQDTCKDMQIIKDKSWSITLNFTGFCSILLHFYVAAATYNSSMCSKLGIMIQYIHIRSQTNF